MMMMAALFVSSCSVRRWWTTSCQRVRAITTLSERWSSCSCPLPFVCPQRRSWQLEFWLSFSWARSRGQSDTNSPGPTGTLPDEKHFYQDLCSSTVYCVVWAERKKGTTDYWTTGWGVQNQQELWASQKSGQTLKKYQHGLCWTKWVACSAFKQT